MGWVEGVQVKNVGYLYGKPNKTYGNERVCLILGCGTVLSQYNPKNKCAAHSIPGIRYRNLVKAG